MVDKLVQKILKRLLIFSLFIVIILFFTNNIKENILGYVFGTIISILNFLLLKESVVRSVNMYPEESRKYATKEYYKRMAIYGIALIISAMADYLSFLMVALGILSIKLVIVISTAVDKDFLKE